MGLNYKSGKVVAQVKLLNVEKLLNKLWENNIKVLNAKKIDIATMNIEINYEDYTAFKDIVNGLNGKVKILNSNGLVFLLGRIKKNVVLFIGAIAFFGILLYLSTYVWAVEIETQKNLSPFEVRQILQQMGVHPGISKSALDVEFIEKTIEDKHNGILWSRARIEGSTLKILIEEKVNPPETLKAEYGNLISKMDGEVQRVYTYSGRAKSKIGQYVRKGDILIEGISGKEGEEFVVSPSGVVMANTFYEKRMQVKIMGTEKKRSGRIDSDIYIKIMGKKIYIKKAIKDFKEYDKIEQDGKIFNKNTYYEIVDKEVTLSKDEAIKNATKELETSLLKDLTREAKIVNKIENIKDAENGNIILDVIFVVEQNIVDNIPVE